MISDSFSQVVVDLDHYLNDPNFDHTYSGELRDRIVRLRDEAAYLRAVLDTSAGEISPPESVLRNRIAAERRERRAPTFGDKPIVMHEPVAPLLQYVDEALFALLDTYYEIDLPLAQAAVFELEIIHAEMRRQKVPIKEENPPEIARVYDPTPIFEDDEVRRFHLRSLQIMLDDPRTPEICLWALRVTLQNHEKCGPLPPPPDREAILSAAATKGLTPSAAAPNPLRCRQ